MGRQATEETRVQSLLGESGAGLYVYEKPTLIRCWTMVILEQPAQVGNWDIGLVRNEAFCKPLSLQTALLKLIVSVLRRVSEGWAELVDELSIFLGYNGVNVTS